MVRRGEHISQEVFDADGCVSSEDLYRAAPNMILINFLVSFIV